VLLGGGAEMIEDDTGLNARNPALGIEFKDVRHVLREVEDDGYIAALAGKRGPATAAENRSSMLTAGRDGGDDVVVVAGNNDANRYLAVVGAVAGIERAAAIVEANFAMDALA
jgi:hypothetical protein